jgi:biopolymer transport protein ExbB/TolQ
MSSGTGRESGQQIAALTTAQEIKSWSHEKNDRIRNLAEIKNGIICKLLFMIFLIFTIYTGIYDEMRVLEDTGEAPDNEKPLTEEEEEKLLTPSDTEADPEADPDMEEEARLRAEREAEKADLEQMDRERKERIRRKKKEREEQRLEQKRREEEAIELETARIRREIEAEAQEK